MKKEKDEITNLFCSRLIETEISVREGFWEELSQDISMACQHRRRLLFFRIAAVASVLLVLSASGAAFWYFSPKEEIEEAFTQLAVVDGRTLAVDGERINALPQLNRPILSKPTPKSYGMLPQYTKDEDSVSITVSMSFSFSTTGSTERNERTASTTSTTVVALAEEAITPQLTAVKARSWAVKAQLGTTLPAKNSTCKMPVSVGVTLERKLNDCIGIEAGLLYSNLRSKVEKLHYLSIPIKMNVTLARTEKFDFYAAIGGIANKCIAGAFDNNFGEEPIQLAVTAGVGVNYKINDRLAIFAEPTVSHHFKTDSKLATVRTQHPTNFSLLCGVRMIY